MQIAIDGSHLTSSNMSGTHNYLYNLLWQLAKHDSVNKYVIYYKNDIPVEFLEKMCRGKPNFSFKKLSDSISFTQVSLAKELYKNTPNILLCPWQTMPIFHKKSMKIVSVMHAIDEHVWYRGGPSIYSAIFSDKIIAVSNYTKSQLQKKYFVPSSKIEVVYEGVDHEHFSKRASDEIAQTKAKYEIEGDYMFFVGTLVKRKNIARVIKAFKCLVDEDKSNNLKLVIGGMIPKSNSSIVTETHRLNISDRVQFLGRVAQKDLPALISGAEFMVYASLSEGFGLPVLEAMASETAVLTSTTGALPEITKNLGQSSALLANPLSVSSICEGMRQLSQKNINAKYVKLGTKNVKKFTWDKTALGVLDVFNSFDSSDSLVKKGKKIRSKILGVKVDFGMQMNDVVARIDEAIVQGRSLSLGSIPSSKNNNHSNIVCTTNPEFILSAQTDLEFKKIINESYLSVPDGVGVIFAKNFVNKAKLYKRKLLGTILGLMSVFKNFFEPTIKGVDLTLELCRLAEQKNYTVFLLGGWPKDFLGRMKKNVNYDLSMKTKDALLKKFPNLSIVGASSNFTPKKNNDDATLLYIRNSMRENSIELIDILFVAYGHGHQEKWLARNINSIPATIGIGVGGTFDYLIGNNKRPPKFFLKARLEWFYRLYMQPWRIKRIFMAFLLFPLKIYLNYLKN